MNVKAGVVAAGLGIASIIAFIVTRKKAEAAPPEGYVFPYCGATFATYEELAAHVQSEHPGARIPLPIEWE